MAVGYISRKQIIHSETTKNGFAIEWFTLTVFMAYSS